MNLREALIQQQPSLALQRAAQAEIARLDALLENLVVALDKTNWSSWQTTARFDPYLNAARDAVAIRKANR